jgi:FkbM family methyltransferase
MKFTTQGIAVINGDEYLSADIERAGRLDVAADYLEQFRPYIPFGGVVVDVGACLGDYTATFSKMVGEQGTVLAFEPHEMVLECLKWNMREYHNVVVSGYALGRDEGVARFEVDRRNIGASWLREAEGGDVVVRSLDSFNFRHVDFMKIDAEGSEPDILIGGLVTLKRCRPVLLVEIDTRALGMRARKPEQVFEWLDILAYEFERFDGPHGNVLCVPKERAR